MRRLILSEVSRYTSRSKNNTKIWASSLNFSKSHLASLQVLCFNNSRWMEKKSFSWSNLEWNTILQMSRLSNSTTEQSMSSSPVTHHLKNNDVLHIFHIRSTKLSRSIFPLTTLIPLTEYSLPPSLHLLFVHIFFLQTRSKKIITNDTSLQYIFTLRYTKPN